MKNHATNNRWTGWLTTAVLTAVLVLGAAPSPLAAATGKKKARAQRAKPTLRLNFESVPTGQLPPGWQCAATHPEGSANPWQVQSDPAAASGHKVLALPQTPHFSGGTFNLCWTDQTRFQDGSIRVKVRAHTGEEDQGGGPIWRVQDANNYYVVRWNPLEDNFRLYYVKAGRRKQIANANVEASPKQWHTIRVQQAGSQIICFLDGKKLLTATDTTFTEAGGVGLWTKADAASSFDDFVVRAKQQKP